MAETTISYSGISKKVNEILNTSGTQYITGMEDSEFANIFVISEKSADFCWSKTEDNSGIVVWNSATKEHDVLLNIDYIAFSDGYVQAQKDNTFTFSSEIGKKSMLATPVPIEVQEAIKIQNSAGTEYITGSANHDSFVINGKASDFSWGKTEDGTGTVVWNTATGEHDILWDVEYIQFTDSLIDLAEQASSYDDAGVAGDVHIIDGNSGDYGWGPTEDGLDIVIWKGDWHKILDAGTTIQFNDGTVTQDTNGEFCLHQDSDGQNQQPEAGNDWAVTEFGTAVSGNVLDNDSDPDGDELNVSLKGNPANGTVRLNADGTYTYTPDSGFVGNDGFTYMVDDGKGGTDSATVEICVGPEHDKASLGDYVWIDSNKDGQQNDGKSGLNGVTVNLKDGNGNVIGTTVTIDDAGGNPGYYLFDDLDPGDYSVEFIKPEGYDFTSQDQGNDATDSDVNQTTGMTANTTLESGENDLSLDAGLVENTPQHSPDQAMVCEDKPETFNVLGNDSGEGLKVIGVTHESAALQAEFESRGGQLSFDANGNVTYQGMADYYGNDKLVYTVEDAKGNTYTETVDVTVTPASDAPTAYSNPSDGWFKSGHFNNQQVGSVPTGLFKYDDQKDELQQFGDYNIGTTNDMDAITHVRVNSYDSGSNLKFNGQPVNDGQIISFADIDAGNLTVQMSPWVKYNINYSVIDGGDIDSDCGGENESNIATFDVRTPIAFDLNGDGEIGVTGESTARDAVRSEIGRTVEFDIDADGNLDTIEWFDGSGDGILIDNRDGLAADNMDGSRLFGDNGGDYANGFDKLAEHDTDGDGKLTGDELNGLDLWVDDGDAIVENGEMKALAEFDITEISVEMTEVADANGDMLMRSTATTQDGDVIMTEDVWFAEQGKLIHNQDEFAESDMNPTVANDVDAL